MKKIYFKKYIIFLVFLLMCKSGMDKSSGYVRKIVIVSSHKQAQLLIDFVNMYRYTPQKEFFFEYDWIEPDNILYYKRHHTLVFLGTMKDSALYSFTTIEQRKKIEERGYLLTKLKDPWVKDQVLYVIGAKDEEDLRPAILSNRDILMNEFYKRIISRMEDIVYERGREEEIEEKINKTTGMYVKIPLDFKLLKDTINFIIVRKHEPDRFMFFARLRKDKRDLITIRDSLTAIYYSGDYVDKKYVRIDSVTIGGKRGVKVTGIWQNDKEVIGGPFTMLAFEEGDSLFILDGGVYAPEKRKLPYILQVEAILRSVNFIKER